MTREEWLRRAVEMLDAELFEGDLDILNHPFQISCSRCQGNKKTECIQPYDGEDVSLDDFFPTTIGVNFTIKDSEEILGNLALECIHAFFNIKSSNSKKFKDLAQKYYFEAPFNEYHPSIYLKDIIKSILNKLIREYGDFPGKAVVFHKKDKKDQQKRAYTVFCPECGYEMKITKKMLDKHGGSLPTCPCGVKMGLDLEDENSEQN